MLPRVYIESSVISYLTAWPSPQLLMAAHQDVTRAWWDDERDHYELFLSEAVVEEISRGDAEAAKKRLEAIQDIPELEISEEARDLAKTLVDGVPLPEKARVDALHIAIATLNGMDYLLTWNCRHIANATFRGTMQRICESCGYVLPVICTPLELVEHDFDD